MQNVLFINGHLNTGGVERSLVDILRHMDDTKYTVDVLLLEEKGDYYSLLEGYGSNSYTRLHSSTVTLNAVKASRTGEKSSVLRTVFPKRAYLERRYPYLKKRPYLLPVAWVQRIAHYAGEKQSGADNSASGSIKLAKGRIELMKRYGIIDEKK